MYHQLPLFIFLSIIAITAAFYSCKYVNKIDRKNPLYSGRKHLGRFGNFIDTLARPKNVKKEEYFKKLNLELDDSKTGDELRSNRNRNLIETEQRTRDVVRTIPVKNMNKSSQEIETIVSILNLDLEEKKREDLTSNERIGVIDWEAFDSHASGHIDGYSEVNVQKSMKSWIKYHVAKRDLVFHGTTWSWDGSRIKRYGRKLRILVN